ncbi:MAG: HAMP domain-containing sensor histidine kinase [bacterium]|nr:HAMP domain-containing sensor histidine kinase [bacterium]
MSDSIVWILLTVALVAAAVAIVSCYRSKRVMDGMERLLRAAMEDDFSDETFDESRMSAIETKFAHFLSASALSARTVNWEKEKIKSLIGDISHQTKTPISNLLLYCELLQEEELAESARSNVDAIYGQANKLRFLIDALVKLSRLENGILVLSEKKVPLQPMLESVCKEYETKAQNKQIALILQETDAHAMADVKWTTEAVGNIVDNAIKYTDEGSVTISVKPYELFTAINVTDTGIGISEAEQSKIFTRFYRSKDLAQQDGVGIGLYLAREIISAEGGYIKVTSKPGEGSTFSIFLSN